MVGSAVHVPESRLSNHRVARPFLLAVADHEGEIRQIFYHVLLFLPADPKLLGLIVRLLLL